MTGHDTTTKTIVTQGAPEAPCRHCGATSATSATICPQCLQDGPHAVVVAPRPRWQTREPVDRILTALDAINRAHGRAHDVSGDMPCPNHCGGTLNYNVGHKRSGWGVCSTEGCTAWRA